MFPLDLIRLNRLTSNSVSSEVFGTLRLDLRHDDLSFIAGCASAENKVTHNQYMHLQKIETKHINYILQI